MSNLNKVLRKMDEHYGLKDNELDRIPYSRDEHRMFMMTGPMFTDDRTINKYWEVLGTIGAVVIFQGKPHIRVDKVLELIG